jgi:histidinol-phosphatase (PHP family)
VIATYHNHSTWSDGATPIAALVERADQLGVDELGISDHYVLHPSGRACAWSMPVDLVGAYAQEIRAYAGRTGPVVRLGLEVDWFPGHADAIRAALDGIDFDYLIGSVHEVDGFPIDAAAAHWNALSPEARDEQHRRYWVAMASLARSGLFDIAAHLDLTKKFGHHPVGDLSDVVDEALDAIAEADLVVEINTAGWHRPCGSAYPTLDILRRCHRRGIPVTLSSDAHEPDHLVRDFERGAARLAEAGYTQVARFAGRRRSFDEMGDAVPRTAP